MSWTYTREYRYRRIARWFDRQAAKLAKARVTQACAAGRLWDHGQYVIKEANGGRPDRPARR